MDLKTKLLVTGYRSYLGILGSFSTDLAARAALDRFLKPRFRKVRSKTLPIFKDAQKGALDLNGHRVVHYHWQGRFNRSILLAHGWESDAGTFGPMIEYLLEQGWSVWALDAPAHGQSGSSRVNLLLYAHILGHFLRNHEDVHASVGHSFGGMALAFANDKGAERPFPSTVIIGSALELRQSLAPFIQLLGMKPPVVRALYHRIEQLSGQPVPYYSIDRMLSSTSTPFLVIHDKRDRVCPISDLEPLIEKAPANVRFHITNGLGHNRIIKDPSIWEQIHQFAAMSTVSEK